MHIQSPNRDRAVPGHVLAMQSAKRRAQRARCEAVGGSSSEREQSEERRRGCPALICGVRRLPPPTSDSCRAGCQPSKSSIRIPKSKTDALGRSGEYTASGVCFSASRRKPRPANFFAPEIPVIVGGQSSGATPERARGTRALPSSWLPACGPVGSKQIEQIENFERNDGFYQDFSCFKDDNLQL